MKQLDMWKIVPKCVKEAQEKTNVGGKKERQKVKIRGEGDKNEREEGREKYVKECDRYWKEQKEYRKVKKVRDKIRIGYGKVI